MFEVKIKHKLELLTQLHNLQDIGLREWGSLRVLLGVGS